MAHKHRYGAQQKGDWWHNDGADFVSPLHVSCEKRFRFDLDGKIQAVNKHCSALKTIKVLRLDHLSLTEDRKRVLDEFIYGKTGSDVISEGQASRVLDSICERSEKGRYYEFCVCIRDALKEHIQELKRISNRRKFVRKK